MTISLPFRRDRRYLTGVDWIIGVLDRTTERSTGAGNSSQIILELEGDVDAASLVETARDFSARFPVLSGRPTRDMLNLAPFWKMDRQAGHCGVEILPAEPDAASAIAALARAANSPFPTERDHLVFRLVAAGSGRTFLGMVFDHRVFDARGAEFFLGRLAEFAAGDTRPPPPELVRPTREPYLSKWSEKFACGRNVNRALRACADARPAKFPMPSGRREMRMRFLTLDENESRVLADTACSLGGYLVKMPGLLAMAVQAVDRVFAGRGQSPGHYLVPVSIDRRAASHDAQQVFFNHISFLHFLIARSDLGSMDRLVQSISRQMYEQTKAGLAGDFEQTMHLARILPAGVLASLSQRIFFGNFGTFAFSFLGETTFRSREFLGRRVSNLLHAPRVSTPPGLGIFLNEYAGRTNVTVSSVEGLLAAEEAGVLAECYRLRAPEETCMAAGQGSGSEIAPPEPKP